MIDFIDVSIHFTGEDLFNSSSFKINTGERIALVGANGSGKSTILKLIVGWEEPTSGKLYRQKNISIGYLPQEFKNDSRSSLFTEVRSSLKEIIQVEEEEKHLHYILDDPSSNENNKEESINKLGELDHKKYDLNYYSIDSNIEKVLEGLGFPKDEFDKPTNQFSGGWQMRVELAKILLGNHDIILLDEPTNHLDIDSLQWLIDFLLNYSGALLLVSHDRYFINKLTGKTLEIFNKKLTFFNGNYDSYLKLKEERDRQLVANFLNQEKKIKQTERFIERFRYKNTKAKQVQSRIKQLDKIEKIQLPEFEKQINVKFPEPPRSGAIPVDIFELKKSYGNNLVFEDLELSIKRGDKIAFVGPNGAGKTTLAKIIAQKIGFDSGEINYGHNTIISYYAQEAAEELNGELDVLDTMIQNSTESTPGKLRTILGSFLFNEDDVFKKIKVLSGGEKSRVALAKILLTKANLIVLDEPTNHLDLNSKRVLQNALINFTGSLIIVSHDVDFIRPIVNRVLELRINNVKLFTGGINYYLTKRNEIIENETDINSINKDSKTLSKKEQKKFEAEQRQKRFEATKFLKSNVDELEKNIEKLESIKGELESELTTSEVFSNPTLAAEKNKKYEEIKNKLEEIYHQWSQASEELEKIENSFK